jgi:hypothetical protein
MPVFLQSLYRALAFWRQKVDLEVSLEKDPFQVWGSGGKWEVLLKLATGGV